MGLTVRTRGAAAGGTFASLRHRNFRIVFSGLVFSHIGSWMQQTALAWLVVELTGSPFALGLLALCRYAPFTALGLVAGLVTDRVDNRRLLIKTQSASTFVAVALAALVVSGRAEVWHAYVLAGFAGAAHVFDRTVRTAFTFQLVGSADLPNAVALNAAAFNLARIIGPVVAGFVIAAAGTAVAFAVNAASFVAVLVGLALIRVDELAPLARRESPLVRDGIREGLAYALRERQVRTVLALLLILATVGFQFAVLVPVIASQTLHAGATGFGVISGCFGAGALAGGFFSARSGAPSLRRVLVGAVGVSLGMIVLAPQAQMVGVSVTLFALGVFFIVWTAASESMLQLTAPDHLRGRVMSLYMLFFGGLVPLGSLLAGWLSDVGGTDLALYVGGGATAAASILAVSTLNRPAQAAGVGDGVELSALDTP